MGPVFIWSLGDYFGGNHGKRVNESCGFLWIDWNVLPFLYVSIFFFAFCLWVIYLLSNMDVFVV